MQKISGSTHCNNNRLVDNSSGFPNTRLRRLRQSSLIREMTAISIPSPKKFIYPVFVCEGTDIKKEITSMPGQYIYSIDKLLVDIGKLMDQGIASIMLFGTIDKNRKSIEAEYAFAEHSIVHTAIRKLKNNYQDLNVFTDVCLCGYTNHGHCGMLKDNGQIDNDLSLEVLKKIAISHIEAGADGVAPSAMMDGQVKAIRTALDTKGFSDTIIISYSTKFASSMYGPFRDAANSSPKNGDRKSYQLDYRDWKLPIRESLEDENEGADILMVKPSLMYLDIICRLREATLLPIAAYNVSGEYSMFIATARNGWGDLKQMVRESIIAQTRSGVDIFISYWANQYDKLLKD